MKQSVVVIMLLLFIAVLSQNLTAQDPSHIFLVKITLNGQTVEFGKPLKITTRDGYNNQPYFSPDGSFLLFSSAKGNQTDIHRYHIASGKTSQLTDTPESEYSPTPMADGKRFSVIQQINTNGPDKGAQKLMAFPLNPKCAVKKVKPELLFYKKKKLVGYHAWIDDNRVAMFILGEPHSLQIANLLKNSEIVAASDIGRSIFRTPGQNTVSFTHYKDEKNGVIKTVDVNSSEIKSLVKMKKGAEYYAWTPGKSLFTAVGSKLFKFEPGKDTQWQEIADFATSGITQITRLAICPNGKYLAVVSNEKPQNKH